MNDELLNMSAIKPSGDDIKVEMTQNALDIAEEFHVKLDFSHKSIKKVERILGKIHKHYVQTKDDDGMRGIALAFAAYIITVIEKSSSNGVWKRDYPDFGEETFPFEWEGSTLFPYGWCLKRIFDGKQDDVWAKYRAIVLPKINE
jgi:hypothetical protein